MATAGEIWTIGHSTRTATEFLAVLAAHGIELVADVRRFPGSRRHPHFGGPVLERTLAEHDIDYAWLARLGGRRRADPGPLQLGWRNTSFRSYAAYTWTEDFAEGLDELLHLARARRTAIMCSELLWWRCHRALVADVLRFTGHRVVHLAGMGPGTEHPWTSPAKIVEGELAYPAEDACCSP